MCINYPAAYAESTNQGALKPPSARVEQELEIVSFLAFHCFCKITYRIIIVEWLAKSILFSIGGTAKGFNRLANSDRTSVGNE